MCPCAENGRQHAVYLDSYSLSSISMDNIAAVVEMSAEQTVLTATEQGLKVDVGSHVKKLCSPTSSLN
jgi:hypothetical protein